VGKNSLHAGARQINGFRYRLSHPAGVPVLIRSDSLPPFSAETVRSRAALQWAPHRRKSVAFSTTGRARGQFGIVKIFSNLRYDFYGRWVFAHRAASLPGGFPWIKGETF
jgi:hypothetical protein